jgi:hypothetical protein
MAPNASWLVTLGIPTIAVLALAAPALALARLADDGGRLARNYALGALAWLAFTAVLAKSGFLASSEGFPPPMLVMLVPLIGLPIWLARSEVGTLLLDRAPLAWLIGFSAFRVPLELVMHQAAVEGTMPPQMTYTGLNFDIVTGLSSIVVAAVVAQGYSPRWLIAAWNTLGSLLLLNIVIIALASLPQFRAFGSDPAHVNTWVAHFPHVWLPAGCVAAALFNHALVWRKLVRDARSLPRVAPSIAR